MKFENINGNNVPDMILGKDRVVQTRKSIQVHFGGQRQVLTTSPSNGGYRENLKAVFNFDEIPEGSGECFMRADTYSRHMDIIAAELGFVPCEVCGLSTAVQMSSAVYRAEEYKGLRAEAIVTGGINVNGGRAGDYATWDERESQGAAEPGTINLIIAVNARLSEGAMTKAVITATEAKTAAIQELMISGCYSEGLATGSGTDGIIIIGDMESDVYLTDAGQHSKLGELIAKAVIPALKESMFLQTGVCAEAQHNVFARLGRFGITAGKAEEYCIRGGLCAAEKADKIVNSFACDGDNVLKASLFAHVLDQLSWGLISAEEAFAGAGLILGVQSDKSCVSKENLLELYFDSMMTEMRKLTSEG